MTMLHSKALHERPLDFLLHPGELQAGKALSATIPPRLCEENAETNCLNAGPQIRDWFPCSSCDRPGRAGNHTIDRIPPQAGTAKQGSLMRS
jgi:hypothetical protein